MEVFSETRTKKRGETISPNNFSRLHNPPLQYSKNYNFLWKKRKGPRKFNSDLIKKLKRTALVKDGSQRILFFNLIFHDHKLHQLIPDEETNTHYNRTWIKCSNTKAKPKLVEIRLLKMDSRKALKMALPKKWSGIYSPGRSAERMLTRCFFFLFPMRIITS